MSITIECPQCGATWDVESDDLRAGTWQRHCPVCRPDDADQEKEED